VNGYSRRRHVSRNRVYTSGTRSGRFTKKIKEGPPCRAKVRIPFICYRTDNVRTAMLVCVTYLILTLTLPLDGGGWSNVDLAKKILIS
jgi:hypothetical protein